MIAVSDAVLVLVSTTALVAGLYRWQNNLEYVPERVPTTQSSSSANASPDNTSRSADSQEIISSIAPAVNNQDASAQSNQTTSVLGTQSDVETSRVVDVQSEQTRSFDATQGNATNQAITDATSFASYTVVAGDSLGRLATRFGTSINVLQEINGIQGSLIRVGQQIRYPLPAN